MEEKTLKQLSEELAKAFDDFKKVNDQLIVEKKEYGEGRAQTKEMLEKLGTRIDEIEVRMKRPVTSAKEEKQDKASAAHAAYFKFLRKGEKALSPEEAKTLIVSDDTTGGFLAPSEIAGEIDKDIVEFSPIRALARISQTSRRSLQVPRREGTFIADWIGENVSQSETTGLKYGMQEIHAHQLRALVEISMENLEDPAFNLETELRSEFAEQFGVAEGLAFVSGNGVTRPEGFLQVASNKVVEQETAGSLALAADDIIDLMFSNIKSAYWANASWLMNRKIIGEVRKLKDQDDQYLWQPGLNGPTQSTLLGMPVVEVTDMPSSTSPFVAGEQIIAFGDWRRNYWIVDRIQMNVLRDPFTLAAQAAVRFIARKRVGGQVTRSEAAVILKVKA